METASKIDFAKRVIVRASGLKPIIENKDRSIRGWRDAAFRSLLEITMPLTAEYVETESTKNRTSVGQEFNKVVLEPFLNGINPFPYPKETTKKENEKASGEFLIQFVDVASNFISLATPYAVTNEHNALHMIAGKAVANLALAALIEQHRT